MSLDYTTKIPHSDYDEAAIEITNNRDEVRVCISVKDGGGAIGNASRVTLTAGELRHVMQILAGYEEALKNVQQ